MAGIEVGGRSEQGTTEVMRQTAQELLELHRHHGRVLRSIASDGPVQESNERRHLLLYARDLLTIALEEADVDGTIGG